MSGIDRLVERQMRNWEIGRSQRNRHETPHHSEVEDFVAISRDVGAGGSEVAAMLGDRLGWPVFDKEILCAMAGDDTLRRQIYESMDERDLDWFEEAARALAQPGFAKDDYFHNLTKTILSLACQARGVFLGRGADLVLPRNVGVRVRLVAPFEQRVRHVAERRSIDLDAARDEVARIDRERAEFIECHFRTRIDEPTRCDLMINRGRLSVQQATELIVRVHESLTAPC